MAVQEYCPPDNCYSPIAIIRQSLFAIRCRFWLGSSIALPLFVLKRKRSWHNSNRLLQRALTKGAYMRPEGAPKCPFDLHAANLSG
ncbi:hypothetical protein [Candidatus Fervidibacter sacchari]|uniref:hypothetical protein n=1 Tax=Candidatus Fervidibacter sacchari TaxID=1448929 RepID=UPI0021682FE9|nr:hypothetical protein [Candidatus Fervidibacter sacchari]